MKTKLTTTLLIIFTCSSLLAAPVSKDRARNVAEKVLQVKLEKTAGKSADTPARAPMATGAPAYYIFNNPEGGFVIIAGDDVVKPIIGFSAVGSFQTQDLPAHIASFLQVYEDNIDAARKSGAVQSPAVAEAWAKVNGQSVRQDGPGLVHRTAKWNQGYPYNLLCPTYGNKQCVTGCVATAMSIMIRFYQSPAQRTEPIPSYNYTINSVNQTAPGVTETSVYNYGLMPLNTTENPNPSTGEYYEDHYISSSATQEEITMIATLMRDCGYMVKMKYGTDASSAYSNYITTMMHKYMGYSTAILLQPSSFTEAVWKQKLIDELEYGPVFYDGQSERGGHQFIIDGYKTVDNETYFHFNFGWGGADDGFYTLSGIEFTSSTHGIIGLRPDSSEKSFSISLDRAPSYNFNNENVTPGSYQVQNLSFTNNDWSLESTKEGHTTVKPNFDIRLVHQNCAGETKSIAWELNNQTMASQNYTILPRQGFSLSNIQFGDRLVFQAAMAGTGKYATLTLNKHEYSYPLSGCKIINPADPESLANSRDDMQTVDIVQDETSVKAYLTYTDGSKEKIVYMKNQQ